MTRSIAAAAVLLVGCQSASVSLQPGSPAGSAGAAAPPQVLELTADEFAFNTDALHAVAGRPIVVHFVNAEGSNRLNHNLVLWRDESREEKLFHGTLIGGGEEIEYDIGSLEPGEYYFECFPHLDLMNGQLVVAGG